MSKLILIGTGTVARHLFDAFEAVGQRPVQVVGRNPKGLEYFKNRAETASMDNISEEGDIYIIAISDDSLHTVIQGIKLKNKLLVHCSGSIPMFRGKHPSRAGVFYPLQTFSTDRRPDFREIPICIEAAGEQDLQSLEQLGHLLSKKVVVVNSEDRKFLHLSAVFANNFTNHMICKATEILRKHNIEEDLIKPLISETLRKVQENDACAAQTGPARRGDIGVVSAQASLLLGKDRELYEHISQSILQTYKHEL